MPGKTARALCPVCQEPMPPDETECENCGAFVIDEAVVRLCRAFGIPREKALALFEKGFRHPTQLKDRDVDDVLQRGENGLLFLCTNCGGFVATGDAQCSRCGAEFETESGEPFPERDILDTTLCPVCGADNDAAWKECEICGEPLGGTEEPPDEAATTVVETSPPPQPATPPAIPEPRPVEPVPSPTLDRIDDILRDLDLEAPERPSPSSSPRDKSGAPLAPSESAPGEAAKEPAPDAGEPVRKRIKWSKKVAPKPPAKPPEPTTRPMPKSRPTPRPRRAPKTVRKPIPKAAPTEESRHTLPLPPSELSGGLTAAAAVALYLSFLFGETYVSWAVVVVVATLAAYIVAAVALRRAASLLGWYVLVLLGGAVACALATGATTRIALALSAGGAVLLALATRRLLTTTVRDLVVAASDVPLVALAAVAALSLNFVRSPAWAFSLIAIVPWPTAVAVEGMRQRRAGLVLHQEMERAQGHLEREQYAASIKDFDRAIARGRKGTPGEEMPWYGKGASLILLGQYEEALRAIDKALDLNPQNEVAWLNKGNALTKMGRLLDALRCFNAAIKVNPGYEVAWNNKGNTLARLGHMEEALSCYDRALELDPEYRGAWVNKGYVLTKLGRYAEAMACADRAMSLDDRDRPRGGRGAETSTGVPSS